MVLRGLRDALLGLNLLHGVQVGDELAVVRAEGLVEDSEQAVQFLPHGHEPLQRRLHIGHATVKSLHRSVEERQREAME